MEGTRNTGFGHFMHRGRLVRLAIQNKFALIRLVQTGDYVKKCGFTRTVWPDQAIYGIFLHFDAHIGQGFQATEAFMYALH